MLTLTNEEFDALPSAYYNQDDMKDIARSWLVKSYPEFEAIDKLDNMTESEVIHYVGTKSINYYGCYTCHSIDGFEKAKPIGAELTVVGSKPVNKLDFAHIHSIGHNNY